MKWNEIEYENANVVYRTEVYRISIYFVVDDDDNDEAKCFERENNNKNKNIEVDMYILSMNIYAC
jgi:hypothetical protein